MKSIAFTIFSTLSLMGSAFAGPLVMQPAAPATAITPSPIFKDEEYFFDLYGSYLRRSSEMDCGCGGSSKTDGFGAGFSIGYYLIPYVALRADANFTSVDSARRQITADVLLRYPLMGGRLNPYLLGGLGFEPEEGSTYAFARAGGGLEWRFTESVGIFAECSYAWLFDDPDKSKNLVGRVGMRFAN